MNALVVLAATLFVLLYLRSPIDLLPDVLGLPGFIDDLAMIGLAIWWLRRRLGTKARGAPSAVPAAEPPWDPYAVLGVAPGASREEIAHAYREQMKRYHPDRVAGLGEEFRALAHARSIAIQRAYAELGG